MEIIFAAATMILVYFIVFQTLFSQQNFALNPPLDQLRRQKFSYEDCFDIDTKPGSNEEDKVRQLLTQYLVSSLGTTKSGSSRDSSKRTLPSLPSLSSARCMGAPRCSGASRNGSRTGSPFASRATA